MSFFGINGPEFLVLIIVTILILGPARTARALVWLQQGIKKIQAWSASMRDNARHLQENDDSFARDMREAFGNLDPSSLDPRKMIKDAVAEEMNEWLKGAGLNAGDEHTSHAPTALLKELDPVSAIHAELKAARSTGTARAAEAAPDAPSTLTAPATHTIPPAAAVTPVTTTPVTVTASSAATTSGVSTEQKCKNPNETQDPSAS